MFWRKKSTTFIIQTDGALLADGSAVGLGVIIRNQQGQIIRWLTRCVPGMTNNEAEYAALCLALESLSQKEVQTVHVYSDSQVMVYQMRGRYQVKSEKLKRWHQRACHLARRFPQISYTHIPRERNQLADALANEALQKPLPNPQAE